MKAAIPMMILALALAASVSAGAANKNETSLDFTCEGGITFTARNIDPSDTVSGQISDYRVNGQTVSGAPRLFVITSVSPNGFSRPGFEDKDTINCSVEGYPGRTFTIFLAPRG